MYLHVPISVIQCNTQGGINMSTISLRVDECEKKTIEDFARLKGLSISQLARDSIFERIENEVDINLYNQAMAEYIQDPSSAISFDDAMKELGLNE